MSLNLDIQEKVIIPIEELEPQVVRGGVEVKDDIIDDKNTWSSQKLSNEFTTLNDDLTQAINNIDLSPYATNQELTDGLATKQNNLGFTPENTANKNAVNGYLGLDSNIRFDSFNYINDIGVINVENFLNNSTQTSEIVSTSAVGGGTYSAGGGSNTPKAKGSTYSNRPILSITANNTGAILARTLSQDVIVSPSKIKAKFYVSSDKLDVTVDCYRYVFLGSITAITAANALTGSALAIRWNPIINNGNYEIVKVVSNSITVLQQTSVTPNNSQLEVLEMEYNKSTETAIFKINNVTINSFTTINIDDATNFFTMLGMCANATHTITRYFGWYGFKKQIIL